MDLRQVLNKYRRPITIYIVALVFIWLYKADLFAGIMADNYFYVTIEAIFAIFITALLLYILMLLIGKHNKKEYS